ncbi:hypothetical protein AQUCO_04000081v1 [Aquilegia coerulea]|uniref:Uncharacterized protein n=1 Tax=Aquilegia coerulea TaxID=218851 RepID=A0A2G5CR35_AQUCA|nr:hypothetical protein AQUCO_04000081v1 [Aquilegia coerulea]PIA33772.1 hypothetical protein AQUCO_04000081v1 [Aquilegia coerulea]
MTELAGRDEHGTEQSISDDVYYQVMLRDRHGRVRLMGRGVTPTSYFGSRTTSSNHNGAHRIEILENEIGEIRRKKQEREEELQREILEMRKKAQELEEQRQQEFDQMKRNFEAQTEDIQRNFDEQSAAMEERILQTLLLRATDLHNAGKRPICTHS